MKGFLFFRWLRNVSLTKKLYFVVGIMALLIAVELFMLSFMIHTLSSTRALVGAEGVWSKAQKDAVYSLTKYGYTHNESDYQQYLKLLAIPLGDRKSRLELLKHSPNLDTVREGFLEGQFSPEDIEGTIKLLTRFHNISYIHNAITIWTQGDYYVGMLQYLGNRLHQQVSNGNTQIDKINETQNQIRQLNDMLTVLENNFSYTLGEGSRWIEHLVLKILFSIAISVEFTGLFLTISVSRAISKGINEIVRVAHTIARADFTARAKVYSRDEIGLLATSFNEMIGYLENKIEEEKQAESALKISEQKFKTLLESAPDSIVIVNRKGEIMIVNKQTEKLFGYQRDELIGKTVELLIPKQFHNKHLTHRENYLHQPKVREMGAGLELFGKRKDGTEFSVEISLSPIETIDGIWVASSIRDVSQRKQNEEQLHKERQHAEEIMEEEKRIVGAFQNQRKLYETLVNAESDMGVGVSITENGNIIYMNNAICEIFGYSREEILTQSLPVENIILDEEKNRLIKASEKFRKGEERQFVDEIRIRRKDGKIIDLEYIARNIEVDGQMQRLSIIRDITNKKKGEEQLRKERERAEGAEIARKVGEQFLANMSHEIRTPMNAIVGFTDIILKTPLTPEQQEYIHAIKISGDNLLVIINDILDFSRIRSGKMPIENRPFKLSQTISISAELMHPKAVEKKIKLLTDVDKNIPDDLIGDSARLSQVLLNLISNALKFTSKGKVTVKVKLLSDKKDEVEIELMVKDTGIGIPREKLDTIFDPFIQANNDTARRYGGTGLGLSIVKQLAALQNGSVTVTSKEGKGACFYFKIKYKKAPASIASYATSLDVPTKEIKKLNILLVEDNAMNQLLAKKVLSDWGWRIDVAENGIEAIKKLTKKDFDIILMDIQMPEMDGYEATRQIRNKFPEPKCNIPIMAMTAHVMSSEEEKCYQAGMNGYISKPFDAQNLYAKIVSIVGK